MSLKIAKNLEGIIEENTPMLSPSDKSKKRGSSRSNGRGSSEKANSTGKQVNIRQRKFFPKGEKHS